MTHLTTTPLPHGKPKSSKGYPLAASVAMGLALAVASSALTVWSICQLPSDSIAPAMVISSILWLIIITIAVWRLMMRCFELEDKLSLYVCSHCGKPWDQHILPQDAQQDDSW